VTGYFDGETDGLLRCGICEQPYHFRLLDWDENQDRRIFALSRMSRDLYERIVAELTGAYGQPNGTYWVPNNPTLNQASRQAIKDSIDRAIDDAHLIPEAVLLAEHIDQDVRSLTLVPDFVQENGRDWWSLFPE
jgi:hypothetical protein